MKLQLAMDICTTQQALNMLEQVHDLIDIIEIGTPMIIREGMQPVRDVKQAYPQAQVLADLKIVDAGEHEASIGFEAGADLVTVLGVADNTTIAGVVRAARDHNKKVLADLITINNIADRAAELVDLGVDLICAHTAFDRQSTGENPLAELMTIIKAVGKDKAAVAGGIDPDKLTQLLQHQPHVVVVGGAITTKSDIREAAMEFRSIIKGSLS